MAGKERLSLDDRLSLFVERADELCEAINEQGFDFNLSFDSIVDFGSPRFERPIKGQVRSVMSLLRLFWLADEPTNFEKLLREAARWCTDQELREFLQQCRKTWKDVCNGRGSITLKVDDRDYSPRVVLDLYFNGDLAHSDPVKRTELKRLRQISFAFEMPLLLAGGQFAKLVWASSGAILDGLNAGMFSEATPRRALHSGG